MDKVTIDNLEIHVTHACNLRCENCTHYSNYGHSGHLSPAAADRQNGGIGPSGFVRGCFRCWEASQRCIRN